MKRAALVFAALIITALTALGQGSQGGYLPIQMVTTAPSGACTQGAAAELVASTGVLYSCQSGTWAIIGGGGGGGPYLPLLGGAMTGATGGAPIAGGINATQYLQNGMPVGATFDTADATLWDVFDLHEGSGGTLTGIVNGHTCTFTPTTNQLSWSGNSLVFASGNFQTGISCAGATNAVIVQVVVNWSTGSASENHYGLFGVANAPATPLELSFDGYNNNGFAGIPAIPGITGVQYGLASAGNQYQVWTEQAGSATYVFKDNLGITPTNVNAGTLTWGVTAASANATVIGAVTDSITCTAIANCIMRNGTILGFAIYTSAAPSYSALQTLVSRNETAWAQIAANHGFQLGPFVNTNAITKNILFCNGTSIEAGYPVGTPICAATLTGLSSSTYQPLSAAVPSARLSASVANLTQAAAYAASPSANSLIAFHGDACTNDMGNGSVTAAACFNNLQTTVTTYRKLGFTPVLIGTQISRTGQDTNKNTWNALVRASANMLGYTLCDIAANPLVGADGAYASSTYFQADGVHLKAAGQAQYAPTIASCVQSAQGATASAPTAQAANSYSMTPADNYLVQTITGAGTTTLPECVGLTGYPYQITNLNSGSFAITVSGAGSETITGSSTIAPNSTARFTAQLTGPTTGGCYWQRTLDALPIAGGALTGPLQTPQIIDGIDNATYHPAACGTLTNVPSWCAGSDMGAWINAAYAAGTSPVGIIVDAGNYSFSTPIVFGVNNKEVTVWTNGAQLTYTASSGTAITFQTGTSVNAPSSIYDLNLTTNVSAATTTGLAIGASGTQANFVKLVNPSINSFKYLVTDISYGAEIISPTFYNCSSAAGSQGITITGSGDDLHVKGGNITGCATNVYQSANENNWLDNVILANATTDDVVVTAGQMRCTACHFVNAPGATALYLNNASTFATDNSYYEDDATSGNSASPIVNTGVLSNTATTIYSAGETYTNFIKTTGVQWNLSYTGFIQDYGGHIADAYNLSTRGDRQITLSNPDFENSSLIPPPGWITVNGAVVASYETSTQYTGKTQSIKFTGNTQYNGLEYLTSFSVVPGDVYSLQCAMKSDATSTPNCVLQFQTNTGGYVSNLGVSNSTTSWVLATASAIVPATAVKAVLFLQNNTAAGAGTSWFDEVSVQKSNFPGEVTGNGHWNTQANSGSNLCGSATLSGTNWAGSGLGPYTHSSGSTVALTASGCTALVAGQSYLVTYTQVAGGGANVTPSFGGLSGTANSASNTYTQYGTATSTTAVAFTPVTGFTGTITLGTVVAQGPKATSCGTPVIVQGSTDHAGKLTTAASGCVITFQTAYTNAPSCHFTPDTAVTGDASQSVTNSSMTVTAVGMTALDYECTGLNE